MDYRKLIDEKHNQNTQKFTWGEVVWLHEPQDYIGRISVGLVKIYPNNSHSSHIHLSEEQVLYVLDGSGIHIVDDEGKNFEEGDTLYCPPYSTHEIENKTDRDMLLLISYTPSAFGNININYPIINKDQILSSNKEYLIDIQNNIHGSLSLSIKFTDESMNDIIPYKTTNEICKLCSSKRCNRQILDRIELQDNSETLIELCDNGLVSIRYPILINETIIGYIFCGHIMLGDNCDEVTRFQQLAFKLGVSSKYIQDIYSKLSVMPRSRLYSINEILTSVSKYLSNIIVYEEIEDELNKKDTIILENTKTNIKLQQALKEANDKIYKYQFNPRISTNVKDIKDISYPFCAEEEIIRFINDLDVESAIAVIIRTIKQYQSQYISIDIVKDFFIELLSCVSLNVFRDILNNSEIGKIRHRTRIEIIDAKGYKELIDVLVNILNKIMIIISNNSCACNNTGKLVDKINIFIDTHYDQKLSLKSIANKHFISTSYLSLIFNRYNGISLTDYINKTRINASMELLINTKYKISVIAKKVGYDNTSYYTQVFKKLESCTPKEYRKKHEC